MKSMGPRILLMGGNYRALCVLERLLDRGERIVAFIGEEGSGERDFCPEILEACDRATIPARSGRKLGEEIVRWLEDRIRPDLVISVGLRTEVPLAIGGNCRLGMIEVVDTLGAEPNATVALRQSGHEILKRELRDAIDENDTAGDLFLQLAEATLALLDEYLDQVGDRHSRPMVSVPYEGSSREQEYVATGAGEPGPQTRQIEHAVGRYVGADNTIALASATAGAHLLLSALDLPPGEEILFPGIASQAFLAAARECGLCLRFVDVDPHTLTVDPERLAELISPRTRAIVVGHTLGQPADLDPVYRAAAAHGLPVIEDATAALGAQYHRRRLGEAPASCVFTLPAAARAGGAQAAFVTLGPELVERVLPRGEKLRLCDAAAGMALRRFERLEDELSARRQNASAYSAELVRYDAFHVPLTPEGRLPTYAAYALRITSFARTCAEDLSRLLAESGIETRMLAAVGSERELCEAPLAERIRASTLLLPVSSALTQEMRDVVLDTIFDYAIG